MNHLIIVLIFAFVLVQLNCTSRQNILLIDWNKTAVNSLDKCHVQYRDIDRQTAQLWSRYIFSTLHSILKDTLFIKLMVNQKYHVDDCLGALVKYIAFYYDSCQFGDAHETVSTAPCGALQYSTRVPSFKRWVISAHTDFMINITIIHAKIPYSRECVDNIAVYDAFNISRYSLIESVCGHMNMEHIYTKNSIASVEINIKTLKPGFVASMWAKYQIHERGAAYKFRHPQLCLLNSINVNIEPSLVFFLNHHLKYLWYMSSSIYYKSSSWGHTTKINTSEVRSNSVSHNPIISHAQVLLQTYLCFSAISGIAVYPGLLNQYLTQWRVPPYSRYSCNITQAQTISMTFHIHATIRAVVDIEDSSVFINMTFKLDKHAATTLSQMSIASKHSLTNDVLHRHGHLEYGTFASDFATLVFKSFSMNGIHSTSQVKVQHFWSDNTPFSQSFSSRFVITEGKLQIETLNLRNVIILLKL